MPTTTQHPAIRRLAESDPTLGRLIAHTPLPALQSTGNVFHDLMSCLIEQQIHYRSTKRVFQKMLEKAGVEILTVENFSIFERKGFENIKLSAQKYETMERVLDFFAKYHPDWQGMDDEAVRSALSQIKGIGPWTMDMILLFTLERPDIFPVDDYHLRQLMVPLYHLDPVVRLKAQMRSVAEAWSPHRSTAVRYLLTWKDVQKNRL